MTEPHQYQLTDEELRRRWEQSIRPRLFTGLTSSQPPLVVFAGGQPGAGKTRLIRQLREQTATRPVVLDSDRFRKEHPRFNEIMAADPYRMPVLTNQAASAWFRLGLDDARYYGYDTIVENTFHSAPPVLEEAQRFKAVGYRVEVAALAVPGEVSRLSIVDRYLTAAIRGEPARWTNLASHQAGYSGAPATLQALDESPVVDRVRLTDRSGQTLYERAAGDDPAPAAGRQLEQLRDCPLSREDARAWLEQYRWVLDTARELHVLDDAANRPVIDALERDSQRVGQHLAADPSASLADRLEALRHSLRSPLHADHEAATSLSQDNPSEVIDDPSRRHRRDMGGPRH